jgi:hypothetical protein
MRGTGGCEFIRDLRLELIEVLGASGKSRRRPFVWNFVRFIAL